MGQREQQDIAAQTPVDGDCRAGSDQEEEKVDLEDHNATVEDSDSHLVDWLMGMTFWFAFFLFIFLFGFEVEKDSYCCFLCVCLE